MKCGMKSVKYALFFFNFCFAVSGIAMVAVGTYSYITMNQYNSFVQTRHLAPSITLIATGSLVFIISFLGCYGAINEHVNMLIGFAFILVIIFILEVSIFTLAIIYKNNFNEVVEKAVNETITSYNDVEEKAWDSLQEKLGCCGSISHLDWNRNSHFEGQDNDTRYLRPLSCCNFTVDVKDDQKECYSTSENLYTEGCLKSLLEILDACVVLLLIVGLVICCIEITAIIMACCLAEAIKKETIRLNQQASNKVFVENNNYS